MEASVIREMDIIDLKEELITKESNLNKMKINHRVAQLENPIEIRKIRRAVARMKTELRRRELEKAAN